MHHDLDATPVFLKHARRAAAERCIEVDYVSGDMRSLPWPETALNAVISWFTSFGYFDDPDNQKVLSEAHRVLRPGGRLLIKINNLAELLPRWLPSVVVERDGDFKIRSAQWTRTAASVLASASGTTIGFGRR